MTTAQDQIDAEIDAELAKEQPPIVVDNPDVFEAGVPFSSPNDEPEVIESKSTTVALPDAPPPWAHKTVEFKGDMLEVRKPSDQALAGFMLASSKYVPDRIKNDIVGLFVKNHVSEETYLRIMERLLDPDDKEYTTATIGELMRFITTGGDE